MASMRAFVATLALASVWSAPPSLAQAQNYNDCAALWYQRNSIYKAAGYCFKTQRAISTFGNAGCIYDSEYSVPLTPSQRQTIDQIVRQERALGCPR